MDDTAREQAFTAWHAGLGPAPEGHDYDHEAFAAGWDAHTAHLAMIATPGAPGSLPPKWHGADYSERRIEHIRSSVPGDGPRDPFQDGGNIAWLIEEIGWLSEQLAAARQAGASAALDEFRRTSRDDYQETYRDFWAPIVENPDGTLNRDQIARELADYADLLRNASEVYCAVTGALISKPNTLPSVVIDEAQEHTNSHISDAVAGAEKRIAALEALAADMLSRFVKTDGGCRARVGQVQIGKWETILDTEALIRHPETRR